MKNKIFASSVIQWAERQLGTEAYQDIGFLAENHGKGARTEVAGVLRCN